jgi:hypothetical protein
MLLVCDTVPAAKATNMYCQNGLCCSVNLPLGAINSECGILPAIYTAEFTFKE